MRNLVLLVVLIPAICFGQDERRVKIYGYVEPYWCYDYNKPANHIRTPNIYSYNRHNEISLNIGLLGATVTDSSYRANFALMSGSYAVANMSNEQSIFQHVFEANAGVRLRKQNNVWLDVGVLPSHIGFESAIGANCATLSRSVLADNTPYFETGIKLSCSNKNKKWNFAFLILNGWQRIEQRNGNSLASIGTQISFAPNEKLLINSSTYAGTDEPDSIRKYRYFHNLYFIWKTTKRLQLTCGFDLGFQQKESNSSSYSAWHSAVIISKYDFSKAISVALRAEYYHDPDNVIISAIQGKDFSVFSYSSNLDYRLNEYVMWRIEFRSFLSRSSIYIRNGAPVHNNFAICGAITVSI